MKRGWHENLCHPSFCVLFHCSEPGTLNSESGRNRSMHSSFNPLFHWTTKKGRKEGETPFMLHACFQQNIHTLVEMRVVLFHYFSVTWEWKHSSISVCLFGTYVTLSRFRFCLLITRFKLIVQVFSGTIALLIYRQTYLEKIWRYQPLNLDRSRCSFLASVILNNIFF